MAERRPQSRREHRPRPRRDFSHSHDQHHPRDDLFSATSASGKDPLTQAASHVPNVRRYRRSDFEVRWTWRSMCVCLLREDRVGLTSPSLL